MIILMKRAKYHAPKLKKASMKIRYCSP